ncbi:MAG: hypothetical protein R3277_11460 [Brumimicrobium sp.]|nr:hypothetical protein [Brumimicrobium sp.]
MEEREGVVDSIESGKASGILKDNRDGKNRSFTNPAVLDISPGDGVNYILINTPKGDVSVIKTKK